MTRQSKLTQWRIGRLSLAHNWQKRTRLISTVTNFLCLPKLNFRCEREKFACGRVALRLQKTWFILHNTRGDLLVLCFDYSLRKVGERWVVFIAVVQNCGNRQWKIQTQLQQFRRVLDPSTLRKLNASTSCSNHVHTCVQQI